MNQCRRSSFKLAGKEKDKNEVHILQMVSYLSVRAFVLKNSQCIEGNLLCSSHTLHKSPICLKLSTTGEGKVGYPVFNTNAQLQQVHVPQQAFSAGSTVMSNRTKNVLHNSDLSQETHYSTPNMATDDRFYCTMIVLNIQTPG